MRCSLFRVAGVLGLSLLSAGSAMAQQKPAAPPAPAAGAQPSQPGATTATYRDWVLRCVTQEGGGQGSGRVCEIAQNLQMQGQGTVASIAVGRADPKGPVSLVIQLPPGVWLPAGVKVQVDDKAKPIQLEFKKCLQSCFAEAPLDAAALQQLRAASEPGNFTFENGARRTLTLPISFKGFGAALDASLKS
ncbi:MULTISPECIES: invasion associated locus B family protein [unclassified Xanthobacter]|uniref:invasion associated locus B family protein n=2 Tax=Xanthobacter TaxID=279 RepID=UPI001F22F7F6|nr:MULTISPECIES: invasion associated locus B family protein [unclassified Xanthobacter]